MSSTQTSNVVRAGARNWMPSRSLGFQVAEPAVSGDGDCSADAPSLWISAENGISYCVHSPLGLGISKKKWLLQFLLVAVSAQSPPLNGATVSGIGNSTETGTLLFSQNVMPLVRLAS